MKRAKKAKPAWICAHERNVPKDSIMFRCACGNVWMGSKFFGSVPKDQSAVSILGAFSRGPAVNR